MKMLVFVEIIWLYSLLPLTQNAIPINTKLYAITHLYYFMAWRCVVIWQEYELSSYRDNIDSYEIDFAIK